jgi:hypothetical protein
MPGFFLLKKNLALKKEVHLPHLAFSVAICQIYVAFNLFFFGPLRVLLHLDKTTRPPCRLSG